MDDPLLAAHPFAGLLLLPVNKAMLTGSPQHTETDLDNWAAAAGVRTFLAAYR